MLPFFHETNKMKRPAGFTLVELVMIIVIIGVLAVVATPRFFDNNAVQARGFVDQVQATLRYAQKEAIAQHRFVCVAFAVNSVTLTTGLTTACGTNLIGPAGPVSPSPCLQTTYSVCSSNASFSTTPTAFNFNALGQPVDTTLGNPIGTFGVTINTIPTPTTITVEAVTGYVHQ